MKKKFFSFLLLAAGLLMSTSAWAEITGTGTETDPFLVDNETDLRTAFTNATDGQFIKLSGNIDLEKSKSINGNQNRPTSGNFVFSHENATVTLDMAGFYIKGWYGNGNTAYYSPQDCAPGLIWMEHGKLIVKGNGWIENTYSDPDETIQYQYQTTWTPLCAICLYNDSELELQSGTIKAVGCASSYSLSAYRYVGFGAEAIVQYGSNSKLTITNGSVIGGYAGVYNRGTTSAQNCHINGGTIEGYRAVYSSGNLNITDGTFVSDGLQAIYAVNQSSTLTANISGGTYNSGIFALGNLNLSNATVNDNIIGYAVKMYSGTANITSGTYTTTGDKALFINGGSTTVTDGKFKTTSTADTKYSAYVNSGASLTLNGGVYNLAPQYSALPTGYSVIINGDAATKPNYRYTVGPAVCQITTDGVTNKYGSIADAVADVTTSDSTTIQMIASPVVAYSGATYVEIASGKNITLDLNGNTITSRITNGTNASQLILNKGTFTVTDSQDKTNGKFNGKIIHAANPTWVDDKSGSYNGSYQSNLISNQGILHIYGGHLENASAAGSTGGAAYVVNNTEGATTNMTDGELQAAWTAVRLWCNSTTQTSKMVIDGGSIEAVRNCILVQSPNGNNKGLADLTINGGTFTATRASGTYPIQFWECGSKSTTSMKVNVNGGIFYGTKGIFEVDFEQGDATAANSAIQVKGGYFSTTKANRATELNPFIAEGYTSIDNDGNNASAPKATYPTMIGKAQQTEKESTYTINSIEASTLSATDAARVAVETNTLKNEAVQSYVNDVKENVTTDLSSAKSNYVRVQLEAATTVSTGNYTPAEGTTVVTRMEFDVKPVYVIIDAAGDETIQEIPNEDIKSGITFRLPVDKNVTATVVKVYHKENSAAAWGDAIGTYAIKGDATTGKYIELTASSFSNFAYEMTDEAVVVTGTVYYYDELQKVAKLNNNTLAEFKAVRNTYPNAIMIVGETYESEIAQTAEADKINVVIKYNNGGVSHYTCPVFSLTNPVNDAQVKKYGFYTPVPFTAVSGSFQRQFYSKYNSCCFPFALKDVKITLGSLSYNTGTSGYKVLTYQGYREEANNRKVAVFYEHDFSDMNVQQGCLLYCASDANMVVTFNNTPIVENAKNNQINALKGDYVYTTKFAGKDNMYSLNADGEKFATTTAAFQAPFRAILDLNGQSPLQNAPTRVCLIDLVDPSQGISTDVEETISADTAVKFLENGKLYIRKNGQVFDAAGRLVK